MMVGKGAGWGSVQWGVAGWEADEEHGHENRGG